MRCQVTHTELQALAEEVGVSQLALDDNQRNPLPSHLDRMGMSKLVWREAAAHTRARGDPPQL